MIYQNDTLATPYEVALAFPTKGSADPNGIRQHLFLVETTLFYQVLGNAFLADLKAARTDFAAAVNYAPGSVYTVASLVRYENMVYTVIQETDGSQVPLNREFFVLANKFTNEEYNFIWNNFLLGAIAYKTMQKANLHRTYSSGSDGYTTTRRDYSEGATPQEVGMMDRNISLDSSTLVSALDSYIMQDSKKDLAVYANYKPILDKQVNVEKLQLRQERHHGFDLGIETDEREGFRKNSW